MNLRERIGRSFALWEVLVTLSLRLRVLRMVDVTKRMCVSKSNVTQLIDKPEVAGLLAPSPPSPRRLIYPTLTPQGMEAALRRGEVFNMAARAHFSRHVTTAEISNVGSGLSKVLSAHEPESLELGALG